MDNLQREKIKVSDKVSINSSAVVCVGKYYDWVTTGVGAEGKVLEIAYNETDRVEEVKVRLSGTKRSYWFYLEDLTRKGK